MQSIVYAQKAEGYWIDENLIEEITSDSKRVK